MTCNSYYKKIIGKAAVLFVFSFAIGFILIKGMHHWRDNNFICDTKFIVKKSDYKLSIIMSYYIKQNREHVIFKGTMDYKGEKFNVSRKNTFVFSKSQNLLYATSTSADKTPADNVSSNLLMGVIPDFYIQKNKKIEFKIYRQGWNGYIFSTGYVPSFYCKRLS